MTEQLIQLINDITGTTSIEIPITYQNIDLSKLTVTYTFYNFDFVSFYDKDNKLIGRAKIAE